MVESIAPATLAQGLEKGSGTFLIQLWLIFFPVLEKVPDTLISNNFLFGHGIHGKVATGCYFFPCFSVDSVAMMPSAGRG
jgi:hypothetical protein